MYLTSGDQELGYWRKANAIHNWFVQNVQHGVDECKPHNVTKEQLTMLRDLCQQVVAHCKLVPGNVYIGTRYVGNQPPERRFVPGLIVEDPSFAHAHLPSIKGFFFGDDTYDENYVAKLQATIVICDLALQHNNVTYCSSW